jgi:pyridoxal/pyridoxine/pyridoxamine kinase
VTGVGDLDSAADELFAGSFAKDAVENASATVAAAMHERTIMDEAPLELKRRAFAIANTARRYARVMPARMRDYGIVYGVASRLRAHK